MPTAHGTAPRTHHRALNVYTIYLLLYLETASPSSVTDCLRLTSLPALPQAFSITFSYVAAPSV